MNLIEYGYRVFFSTGRLTSLKPFELKLFIVGEYNKSFILRSVTIGIKPGFNIGIIRFNEFIKIKEKNIGLPILLREFKGLSSIRCSTITMILINRST